MMKHKSNGKYRLILAEEVSKVNATVRKQQSRRDRHIGRRKQQRYDALDKAGKRDYKWTGQYHQDLTMSMGYDKKITPIDILVTRELGRWNGYVYGLTKNYLYFVFAWWIMCGDKYGIGPMSI